VKKIVLPAALLPTSVATAISLAVSGAAFAQDTQQEPDNDASVERIIVTGTSKSRLIAETPQSVTSMNDFEVARLASSSQADVLRYIPGVKVEGGGGEVATNLQVRGLPSSGQFQFTPLLYDGSPTLSAFGLNSSAYDVYYRNDLGIERVEFVRGGVSNLFGQGSVAGVINYISKVGGDDSEATMQLELSDQSRKRFDFAASGPLNDDGLYYALSGFYRYDEGPLDTGLATEGMQIRGNIQKQFEDGSGYFTVYGQAIDDQVQFFLPFPLDGESRERLTGNDGNEVESLQTVRASNLSYDTPNGRYESPIADGVSTKGQSISFELNKELTDSVSILARAKYADYRHEFNLFLDGDGIINVPETQAQYLANRGLGDLANASFTYADSGEALGANDLLFANRILDRDRPTTDFSSELNIIYDFDVGDFAHSLTIGGFFSKTDAEDDNVTSRYLGEFNNIPRLINLSVVDVDGSMSGIVGNTVTVSQNGVTGPGIGYSNRTLSAERNAIYIADQMENDDWIIDLGFRWESIDGTINTEGTTSVLVNDDPSLHPNLQVNTTGSGSFTYGEVSNSEVAFSAAVMYKWNDFMNVYANVSRGFFFPEIRGVRFSPSGEPNSYESEIVEQAEIGVKFFTRNLTGSVALFKTDLKDRRSVDFVNDANGNVVEVPVFQSTEAHGIEMVASYELTDTFTVDANLTWTDHEFSEFESDPNIVGNELRRKPNLMFNSAIRYQGDNWDAGFYHNYHGKNFTNDANTVELDDFHIFRVDAGYSWKLNKDEQIRASVGVFNLFDSDGVTEGSPRLGNSQTADNPFFVGRPILPRRVTFRVRYDF